MDAEILIRPPISGKYEEHNFVVSGNALWVKFMDDNYLEWVGGFEKSEWKSTSKVLEIPNEKLYLVIAGGQGYFVNPNTRKIIKKTNWDDIEDIIYNYATKSLVATDGLSLAVFVGCKLVWSGNRVSADGISFTAQDDVFVKGVLNNLTNERCIFTFNVKTKTLDPSRHFNENWD